MAKHHIKTKPDKFFLSDGLEIIKIACVGTVFGVMTVALQRFLLQNNLPIVGFRMGLVISGVVATIALLKLKNEAGLLISVATIVSLWNLWFGENELVTSLVIYGTLSAVLMAMFGWICQLKKWQLRIMISAIVTLAIIKFF